MKVHVLSTFKHCCFELTDNVVTFKPQTDLALLNAIATYIIQSGSVNEDFIKKHVNFREGQRDFWCASRENRGDGEAVC